MKEISAKEFFKLCRGSKRTDYEAIELPFGLMSYMTTYERNDGSQIFKLEHVPNKAGRLISFSYYKEA